MGTSTAAVVFLAFGVASMNAQEHIHKRELKQKLFTKGSWIKTGATVAWEQIRNSPHEWGRNAGGLAKRAGSSAGQRAIKGVTEYTIASMWTHEDTRYRRSGLDGKWPRVRYAVVSTFWVPRDVPGGNTFAVGRVAGAIVGAQVSRAWLPQRVATFGAGMSSAGLSVGFDVGLNVVREFWRKPR
jgi:hypothetical protein